MVIKVLVISDYISKGKNYLVCNFWFCWLLTLLEFKGLIICFENIDV